MSIPMKTRDFPCAQSPKDAHDVRQLAYYWVNLGFGVVPMPTNKKMPVLKAWPDLALTDAEQVEIYWSSFARRDWRNIALTLDGWTVVDVDPKNGGSDSFAKLEADYGPLPATRRHATPSGGFHLVYRTSRPVKSAPLNPDRYPGIDIKTGRAALIVAPGSVANGRPYEEADTRDPAVAPPWLSEIQAGTRAPWRGERSRESHPEPTTAHAPALAELRALPADDPGRGNHWLCQVAGHLARTHTDYNAYLAELREIDGESEFPHEEDRLMKTADSIWQREQAKPEPTNVDAKYERTDLGEARRLRDWYGSDLRFVIGRGWLGWDGRRRWIENNSCVWRAVHEMSDRLIAEALKHHVPGEPNPALNHAEGLQNTGKTGAIIAQAKHLPELQVPGTAFDADPYKLLVGNGVVDLRTGELLPNRREYLITKGSSVDYDPQAECPQWDAFLKWAFKGDADLIDYIQRMAGEILIGNNDGQRAYFLYGPGGNGKSQLIEVLAGIVGEYFVQALPDLLTAQAAATHTEAEANLAGSRMVAISETRMGQVLDESRFNRLSGDKTQRASRKGEQAFEFPTTFTMVMYGNVRPTIPFTEGVRRRVKVIKMDARVTEAERVEDLSGKLLREEGPAILAWAVRGAVRVASGERADDPPTVTKAVKDWQRDNNPFGEFADEYLTVGLDHKLSNDDLWTTYELYRRHGGREFAKNVTQLGQRLMEWASVEGIEGIERPANAMKFDGKRKRGFKGIKTNIHLP